MARGDTQSLGKQSRPCGSVMPKHHAIADASVAAAFTTAPTPTADPTIAPTIAPSTPAAAGPGTPRMPPSFLPLLLALLPVLPLHSHWGGGNALSLLPLLPLYNCWGRAGALSLLPLLPLLSLLRLPLHGRQAVPWTGDDALDGASGVTLRRPRLLQLLLEELHCLLHVLLLLLLQLLLVLRGVPIHLIWVNVHGQHQLMEACHGRDRLHEVGT